jgi:hypothetical protein
MNRTISGLHPVVDFGISGIQSGCLYSYYNPCVRNGLWLCKYVCNVSPLYACTYTNGNSTFKTMSSDEQSCKLISFNLEMREKAKL